MTQIFVAARNSVIRFFARVIMCADTLVYSMRTTGLEGCEGSEGFVGFEDFAVGSNWDEG